VPCCWHKRKRRCAAPWPKPLRVERRGRRCGATALRLRGLPPSRHRP
jgi:hypothetical protein